MKAATYRDYGPPEVVSVEEVPKPIPADGEVLLRVRAASVNPIDWHQMRGDPPVVRLLTGLRAPKYPGLGTDVAGEIEAAGAKVARLKPGDAVFGTCLGAFAEYAVAAEPKLVKLPENVSFEQAAAVPVAGFSALQAVRDVANVEPGQTVLVNGAAGGVGTFAVQIAKTLGAVVTGVCSTGNVEMVRSIGADRVIDYTREDFTRADERYDVLIDCVGNRSLARCRHVLKVRGTYVPVGGSGKGFLREILRKLALAPFAKQKLVVFFLAKTRQEDLRHLAQLVAARKVTPVIDRSYGLGEVREAIRYLERGHARGKVVVTM